VKRTFRILAFVVSLVAMAQLLPRDGSRNGSADEAVPSRNATYRLTLYCSKLSGQDSCTDLQDINEKELESISKVISEIGPSGVERNVHDWTAIN
jgi:hypothetical protein